MNTTIVCEPDPLQRASLCRDILATLPDWFGIPEAVENYIVEAAALPMLVARETGQDGASDAIGFATITVENADTIDLHLIAIRPAAHRRGVGRRLLEAVGALARQGGYKFLSVKTLAPSIEDANYAATRAFYEANGFEPQEILPDLWAPDTPCLVMRKTLR
ncbi:MAG: GNAT family N-acetyltransferase [Dongiaceae bacterium]